MERSFFFETYFPEIPHSFLIIDMDGTLVTEGTDRPESLTRDAISRLKKYHTVCLTSNGKNRKRNVSLARSLAVPYVPGIKPFGKITDALRTMNRACLPVIVIGDRYLTDGLLALRLRGAFIPVKPLRTRGESWHTKAIYALDTLISSVIRVIKR